MRLALTRDISSMRAMDSYILRLTLFIVCSMHTPALLNKGASGGGTVGGAGLGVLRLWLATTGSGGTGASAGTKTCAANRRSDRG